MDEIGKKIGASKDNIDPWYKVSVKELSTLGAHLVLQHFNHSKFKMLTTLYPEIDWVPWKFENPPRNVGGDMKILKLAIGHTQEQLGVKAFDDWYRVSARQLKKIGTFRVIIQNGGLFLALKIVKPEYSWREEFFLKSVFPPKPSAEEEEKDDV